MIFLVIYFQKIILVFWYGLDVFNLPAVTGPPSSVVVVSGACVVVVVVVVLDVEPFVGVSVPIDCVL